MDAPTEDWMEFGRSEEEDDRGRDGGFDVLLRWLFVFFFVVKSGRETRVLRIRF